MAKLPKTVKVHPDFDPVLIEQRSSYWGSKNRAAGMFERSEKQIISYTKNLKPGDMEETILHELLHSIFYNYDININNRTEERLVTDISIGLFYIIKNNPKLINWLLTQSAKPNVDEHLDRAIKRIKKKNAR